MTPTSSPERPAAARSAPPRVGSNRRNRRAVGALERLLALGNDPALSDHTRHWPGRLHPRPDRGAAAPPTAAPKNLAGQALPGSVPDFASKAPMLGRLNAAWPAALSSRDSKP